MTFFKYHFLIIFLFSLFFTGCEIGITPLEHAPNEIGIETTGAVDSDGNIGAISIVIPEGLGDLDVQIEIYGPGSEHFIVAMDKTAYGYIGEVTVKPDFIVYQDTTFNFSARTVVNGQKLCAKEIQKTVKRTEVAPVAIDKNANLNEDTRTTIQLEATDKNIHLIITTHSPFLLSDIPKQNIIFLDKDENGNCKVVDGLKEKKQTFGANIHTLLSDSFFMEDGLMGEFAKSKIDKAITLLNKDTLDEKELKYCEQIISIIGEPIIKNQLQRILDSKRLKRIDEIDIIKKSMLEMQKRLDELEK